MHHIRGAASFWTCLPHKLMIFPISLSLLSHYSCNARRAPGEQLLCHTLFLGFGFYHFDTSYLKVSLICPQRLSHWGSWWHLAVHQSRVVEKYRKIDRYIYMSNLSLILPGSEVGCNSLWEKVPLSDVEENVFNCIYRICQSSGQTFKHIATNHV